MFKKFSQLLSLFVLLLTSLSAKEPYQASLSIVTESSLVSAPNLVDLTRDLKTTSLQEILPFYTPVSPLALNINLRGITAIAAFAANSTTLTVAIPQAQLTKSFTGGTRDESLLLFKDYIRDGGEKHRLLRAYAKYSPIDPIAGNPDSLMAKMAEYSYQMGHLYPLDGCDCISQPTVHQFQVGLDAKRGFSHGFDTTAVTLPLRYSFAPRLNGAFILDAPFTYFRNGGASSAFGSFGFGARLPITKCWSLTPQIRVGAGGSLDLCTSGSFASFGLTSVYHLSLKGSFLSLTNYAGYFSSTNLWLTGINFNYHLHNYVFKNGLALTSCEPLTFCGRQFYLSASFQDTCFTKDSLYIEHFNEVSLSLITSLCQDTFSLGTSYQFGQKSYKGFSLNLRYLF